MTHSTRFARSDSESARSVAKQLLPDPKVRRVALDVLRRGIEQAHAQNPASWGVTLSPGRLRLNVGRGAIFSLERESLTLKELGVFGSDDLQKVEEEAMQRWQEVVAEAASDFARLRISNPSWRGAHSSGVLELLRDEFNTALPDPSYAASQVERAFAPLDLSATLQEAIAQAELFLPPRFVALFYTALQTKGFVVLSGLSGTGKTRLATTFAALLPQPGASEETATLDPQFRVNGRVLLPPQAAQLLSDEPINITCDGHAFKAKWNDGALVLRGAARKCALQAFGETAEIGIESEFDDAGRINFRLLLPQVSGATSNHLFLPVRPDWSDDKPLLGYFNPLLNRYEWTPFLRFLLRAEAGFKANDGLAYFVILDEMNLARAEHYFADLLSVLETGRDESGRTREPLRFDFDGRATGELPPRKLFLPPNLYFVGTLNADETTFPLSPKVLDRAWVLEAPRVNFSDYPPQNVGIKAPIARRELLRQFTREGAFSNWDKALVTQELETAPQWRDWLQELNSQLQEQGAGFGFRAFDEIVAFCAFARANRLFASPEDAFDAAVEAKLLSRLSGGRLQMETTLDILLAWTQQRSLSHSVEVIQNRQSRLEREGFI